MKGLFSALYNTNKIKLQLAILVYIGPKYDEIVYLFTSSISEARYLKLSNHWRNNHRHFFHRSQWISQWRRQVVQAGEGLQFQFSTWQQQMTWLACQMHLLEHIVIQYGSISKIHSGSMIQSIMDPSTPTPFLHSIVAMPAESCSGVRLKQNLKQQYHLEKYSLS